jgi:hypothetical protein
MACLVIEDSNLTVQIAALRRALGEVLGGEGPCTVGAIGLPCLPSQRTSLNTFLDDSTMIPGSSKQDGRLPG